MFSFCGYRHWSSLILRSKNREKKFGTWSWKLLNFIANTTKSQQKASKKKQQRRLPTTIKGLAYMHENFASWMKYLYPKQLFLPQTPTLIPWIAIVIHLKILLGKELLQNCLRKYPKTCMKECKNLEVFEMWYVTVIITLRSVHQLH